VVLTFKRIFETQHYISRSSEVESFYLDKNDKVELYDYRILQKWLHVWPLLIIDLKGDAYFYPNMIPMYLLDKYIIEWLEKKVKSDHWLFLISKEQDWNNLIPEDAY